MPAHTIALLGDSITAFNGSFTTIPAAAPSARAANGYWTWADQWLSARLELVNNAGVGGDTTAQILARITSITGMNPVPGFCIVEGGTNDVAGSVPATTIIANLKAICNQLIAAGVVPILLSLPPNNTTPIPQGAINRQLADFARTTPNVLFVDFYRYITDPTTGHYATAYTADGVHPNAAGASLMGYAIYLVLNPIISLSDTLVGSNVDAENLVPNGLFLGTGGTLGTSTGVIATSWTSRFGSNAVLSQVARTDGVQGTWQQIAYSSPGATATDMFCSITTNIGDVVVAEFEYQLDVAGLNTVTDLGLLLNNGAVTESSVSFAGAGNMIPGCMFPSYGVIRSAPTVMGITSMFFLIKFSATAGTLRVSRASAKKIA